MISASGTSLAVGDQATWESLLRAPGRGQHVAQFYTDPEFLVRALAEYARQGLRQGEAVLMVATATHAQAITRRLQTDGLQATHWTQRGQLIILDAGETLARLLVDGEPDRSRFQSVIGGAVSAAKAVGGGRVRAFGEMVNLLRRTSLAAALRLEELWTEFLQASGIALVCGYSIDTFDPGSYNGLLQRVMSAHSHFVPAEDYVRLDRAVERAYVEVFGSEQDAANLRRAFLAHYARPAAMPDAQAAILAAREFVPSVAADALVERVRHHYQNRTATAA
jgi:KaiC/GvpD/RAD55 family RecA-like ATPase